ncbi:MAG: NADH-quinone oxidoreductase subunit C, partial [bacterium]|nr:NADH-quinone oxidoreductase subunit C [bacterium]
MGSIDAIEISLDNLLQEVSGKHRQGYRFVTMTCTDVGDGYDILYHFDKDYELFNLRLYLKKGEELLSISSVFFAALLAENEIKDLFGIPVRDLAIDYGGRFLLTEDAPVAPMG